MQSMINVLLDPVVNFGKVTVSAGYTSADTEVTLITGDGSKLPYPVDDGSFNLVWFNNSTYSDPADDPNVEIVRCIARVDDTLILMRHQEGTLASDKNVPTKIYKMILAPTKKTIDDIGIESQSKVDTHSLLSTGIHGIGADTIDGVSTRNIAISTHSSTTSNIHNFDVLGNAPAQIHGISKHDVTTIDGGAALPIGQLPVHGASKHTGTIGTWANIDKTTSNIADITTKNHTSLTDIGSNTHTQIDTAITASMGHIAANGTSVHNLGTMSTQAASNVSITGGSITSITGLTVSGNVGIGTTSPQQLLHLLSANGEPFVSISNGGTNYQGLYLGYSTTNARAKIRSSEPGIANRPLSIGGQTIAIQTSNAGNIEDGTSNVVIFIGTEQNVGIGTTSPETKLHVQGGYGSPLDDGSYLNYLVSRFKNTGSGNQAYVEIRSALTGNCGLLLKPSTATGTSGWGFITNNSGDLRIAFGSGITDLKDGVGGINILASNNYVGIGTTNPGYKLSVAGTIESTSGGFRFPDGTTQATTAVAGGFSTISDVLSSRAQDTVYQNTSGKTMFVEVHFINSGTNQGCTAYTGASNPPTVVHHMNAVAGLEWVLPFIVLPNHYYKIVKDGGQTLTLQDWYEYT